MNDNLEIRSEIAVLLGWNPPGMEVPETGNHLLDATMATLTRNCWSRVEDGQLVRCSTHPVGNSLDVVASLLPAGWNIKVEKDNSNTEFPIWNAYADQPEGYGSAFNSASTELEARLMNLREILQHEKKEKGEVVDAELISVMTRFDGDSDQDVYTLVDQTGKPVYTGKHTDGYFKHCATFEDMHMFTKKMRWSEMMWMANLAQKQHAANPECLPAYPAKVEMSIKIIPTE